MKKLVKVGEEVKEAGKELTVRERELAELLESRERAG
eukprot:CAMPEP_0202966364 /NCGR_PEP_ID=MMETSP1396-20130829/10746_1 /ASSEMBLY_ACC=CAM_ASM_000872 /TAXON_ID= /ORGANISM="Pseudokeronopsis sp., Strain Brazil" /LENGTH=36 /DNA_ID= /DNA_START= /DNA_END= /DNA_ORIENTATION=